MAETSRLETKNIRGLRTGWFLSGNPEGDILLLLHGYPDSPDIWERQEEHFRDRYLVVRPFNRGLSPSEPSRSLSRYGLDSLSLDWLEILRQVDPTETKKIICVGHDLGAVQAWHLAPLLGKRLSRLVILGGLSLKQAIRRLSSLNQVAKSWYIFFMQLPVLPSLFLKSFPATLLTFAYSAGRLPSTMRPRIDDLSALLVNPAREYKAFVRDVPKVFLSEGPKLKAPVLMLFGDKDPFVNPPQQAEVEREARDVTIRILEGGHWLFREKAEVINELLEKFIQPDSTGA